MPWNGTGTYSRDNGVYTGPLIWNSEATDGNPEIQSTNHDTHDQDIAAGITACLAKNGENAMTGDLDMGSNTVINVAAATVDAQLMLFGQMIQSMALSVAKVLTLGMPDNTGQADLTLDLTGVMDGAMTDVVFSTVTNILTFTVQNEASQAINLASLKTPQAGTTRPESFFFGAM